MLLYKKWLWLSNNYYFVSRLLTDSFVALNWIEYYFLIWINEASMILAVWKKVISLYNCDLNIILYPVHWLILYLLESIVYCFNFCSWYICKCFCDKWFLCILVKILLLWHDHYIFPVHWMISFCLVVYIFAFYMDYCRGYFIGCLTRSDIFVEL